MCFSNPDGVIRAVSCLTSDFKRTLISPSGQGGFHSQCEALAFFVPCKSDSGKYSPRGFGGVVVVVKSYSFCVLKLDSL